MKNIKRKINITKIYKQALSLIFTMLLVSCENILIIETDNSINKIVVNSVFNNIDTLKVEVTKSFAPNGNINVQELSNAKVSLYKNGQFVELLTYRKTFDDFLGKFVSTTIPEPEQSYSIEVNDPELGIATSSSSIPTEFDVTDLSAVKIQWGEDNLTSMRFNFKFTLDDAESTDYYYLTMAFPVLKKDENNGEWYFYAFQYCEIETGDLPLHQLYLKNGLLFEDKAFNGTKHVVSGSATTYQQPFGDFDFEWPADPDKIKVDSLHLHINVYRLSKELYTFYSSHATVLKNENNVYSEPTPVYSNVENGTGIFGGEFAVTNIVETK